MVLYLSGNIAKGSAEVIEADDKWTAEDEARLADGVTSCRVVLINPARSSVRRSDPVANFGADIYLVASSDAVVVDARGRRGVGVGAEMMFARLVGVPVITVSPPNSAYRQEHVLDYNGEDIDNWVHPFIAELSSAIVSTVDEAASLLNQLGLSGVRSLTYRPLEESVALFLRQYLDDAVASSAALDRIRAAGRVRSLVADGAAAQGA
jgi:hypothetical protein